MPPTLLSTIATTVVGIWISGRPRRNVAATKPARSPVTPPPTANTQPSRVIPAPASWRNTRPYSSIDFDRSPAGIRTRTTRDERRSSQWNRSVVNGSAATPSSTSIATGTLAGRCLCSTVGSSLSPM